VVSGAFGNEPLYVVDGIPVGSIDYVSPDDIANYYGTEDAAAASICRLVLLTV
jgi:hypothetical protein